MVIGVEGEFELWWYRRAHESRLNNGLLDEDFPHTDFPLIACTEHVLGDIVCASNMYILSKAAYTIGMRMGVTFLSHSDWSLELDIPQSYSSVLVTCYEQIGPFEVKKAADFTFLRVLHDFQTTQVAGVPNSHRVVQRNSD